MIKMIVAFRDKENEYVYDKHTKIRLLDDNN